MRATWKRLDTRKKLFSTAVALALVGGSASVALSEPPPRQVVMGTLSTLNDRAAFEAAEAQRRAEAEAAALAAAEAARLQQVAAAKARASRSVRVHAVDANVSSHAVSSSLLARIRWCESRDNYTAQNRRSTASGAYQILDSTWRGWQESYGENGQLQPDGTRVKFSRAMYAPPEYQDLVAGRALAAQGPRPWYPSRHCWA